MSEFGASATGSRFGCPRCGGGLKYDIASGKLVCDRCGELTDLSAVADRAPENDGTMEVTEFHCPQCGAMVYSTDTSVTGFCSFCGSDVVFTSRMGRTRRPSAIVPFTVTREDCEAHYREHLKHYHLKPASMDSAETISHFRPVYVPFWSYHVRASGFAGLKGHKNYTKGNYNYDEDYDLSMNAQIDQDHILYDASTAFEDETAAMLQHTAAAAVPFHPAYLSGLYAQAADVAPETYQREAAASAVRMFMDRVKDEYEMDRVEMIGDSDNAFGLPNAEYSEDLVMMPVWLLAQRHGQRVIYTAVNGSTGQVICDIPVSFGRLACVILAAAAAIFALLHLFLTVKPEIMMVLCAALLMISQFQFGGAQTVLNLRRTRAYEPDFAGGRAFVGPAQALLTEKDHRIRAASGVKLNDGKARKILSFILTGAFIFVFFGGTTIMHKFGSVSASSGGRFILTLFMLGALVTLIVHFVVKTKQGGSGPVLPRIVALVACAAGTVCIALGVFEDLVYYACAAAMLAAAIWELVIITRAHNEYASRPIPFFEREEAEQ